MDGDESGEALELQGAGDADGSSGGSTRGAISLILAGFDERREKGEREERYAVTFQPDANGFISEVFDFHAREESFSPCQKMCMCMCMFMHVHVCLCMCIFAFYVSLFYPYCELAHYRTILECVCSFTGVTNFPPKVSSKSLARTSISKLGYSPKLS